MTVDEAYRKYPSLRFADVPGLIKLKLTAVKCCDKDFADACHALLCAAPSTLTEKQKAAYGIEHDELECYNDTFKNVERIDDEATPFPNKDELLSTSRPMTLTSTASHRDVRIENICEGHIQQHFYMLRELEDLSEKYKCHVVARLGDKRDRLAIIKDLAENAQKALDRTSYPSTLLGSVSEFLKQIIEECGVSNDRT